jgi:branched-chain amino acid transport system permease protein
MVVEEIIIFGAVQGAVYALLALGYSLVYGVGGVLNLAHGAYYLIGTYAFYITWDEMGRNTSGFFMGMLMAVIFAALSALLSYFLIIRPMREHEIMGLIGTFALAFFFEQLIIVGYNPRTLSIPPWFDQHITLLGIQIQLQSLLIIIFALITVVLITIFINKSKLGTSIRAVSQDREAAMLMGINADRVLMYTIIISGLLAGVASALYTPSYEVAPHIGWSVLTGAIAVVILGGMGSLPGSVIGAFILGYVRIATIYIWEDGAMFTSLVPVIVIIVILIVRPRGLFGKKEVY